MTHTTRALVTSLLVIAAAACSKSKDSDGKASGKAIEGVSAKDFAPCDTASVTKLAEDLDKANCLNVDLTDKSITDACEAMKTQINGKRYALKGCTFSSQGNDEVSFGATGTDKTLGCVMKGGEAGVKDFRQAAMKLEMSKLRLDVTGTIALGGTKGFERLQMTDCQISAHE